MPSTGTDRTQRPSTNWGPAHRHLVLTVRVVLPGRVLHRAASEGRATIDDRDGTNAAACLRTPYAMAGADNT
eukprot:2712037-Rhodomonas_salina.5